MDTGIIITAGRKVTTATRDQIRDGDLWFDPLEATALIMELHAAIDAVTAGKRAVPTGLAAMAAVAAAAAIAAQAKS